MGLFVFHLHYARTLPKLNTDETGDSARENRLYGKIGPYRIDIAGSSIRTSGSEIKH